MQSSERGIESARTPREPAVGKDDVPNRPGLGRPDRDVNVAATARIAAYCFAVGLIGAFTIGGRDGGRSLDAAWRDELQHVQVALAWGDGRAATAAWENAGRAAMGARTPEGLLEVGRAALRIGAVTGDRPTAVARARKVFLAALFQARERRDATGVAHAGEAFAAIGDREVADRAFKVAMTLAGQDADAMSRERVAMLWDRVDPARPRQ